MQQICILNILSNLLDFKLQHCIIPSYFKYIITGRQLVPYLQCDYRNSLDRCRKIALHQLRCWLQYFDIRPQLILDDSQAVKLLCSLLLIQGGKLECIQQIVLNLLIRDVGISVSGYNRVRLNWLCKADLAFSHWLKLESIT